MKKIKIKLPQIFFFGIFLILLSMFYVGALPTSITGSLLSSDNIIYILSHNTTTFLLSTIGSILSIISGIIMLLNNILNNGGFRIL